MKKPRLLLVLGLSLILASFLLAACGKEEEKTGASSPATAAPQAPVPSAASPQGPPAAITAVNIADPAVLARQKPLVITFAQNMVRDADVNKDLDAKDAPFALTPALAGKGRWLTPKSFAFAVDEDFAPGTEYTLYFKEDLKALDGRPARYVASFRTQAVNLHTAQPGAYDARAHTLQLHLEFSVPVKREALAEHLRVIDAGSGEALKLEFSESAGDARTHTLRAHLGAYRPALHLELRMDKKGDAHPLGLASEYTLKIDLPEPGADGVARLSGSGDKPSPISLYHPSCGETGEGRLYAWFSMSESLLDQHQKDFIIVSPDLPYTMDSYGSTLNFDKGLEPGMELTVTLKAGLTDAAGRVLKEDRSASVTVPDYDGAVRFAEQGSFLTPLFGSRVAVNLVNADRVNVTLRRQYENNLPFMTMDPDYRLTNMMRRMTMKEIEITGLARNEIQRRALDLESLAGGARGVFLLTLEAYSKSRDEHSGAVSLNYCNEEQRLVVLTDIGLSARVFPSGITVLATDLTSARPIKDAAVKVFSASNQLVARGYTNADGFFLHQRPEKWDPQLEPAIVVAQSGGGEDADMTFLPLNYETGLREEDPALRTYLDKGCEAFVYTPRGVFRPGERVQVKSFVRDADHQAPEPFPVIFRVLSSRGLEAARASALLSEEGGADFAFTLPASAPSGQYRALVEIPGSPDEPLGFCDFSVEDFTPPRLEVSLRPQADVVQKDGVLPTAIGGRYLFGAPGAGLSYELGYRVQKEHFAPEGFEGYSFGDAEREFGASSDLNYLTGNLPDSGEISVDFTPPADWAGAQNVLRAQLVASVQEDGGRWVSRSTVVRYFPAPYVLGLKPENDSFRAGEKAAVAVAVVDPAGNSAEAGPLTAEISRIQGNWHTVYRDGRYVYTYDERFIPLQKTELAVAQGRGLVDFVPDQPGRYLVRVLDKAGDMAATCRLSVSGNDGAPLAEGTGRMDKVELTLDKTGYRAGDTAKLTVRAPFAGTLFLGLERGGQMYARVLTLEEPGQVIDIPVTEGMDPNITVTANVIRPLRAEEREWYSHRAFGTVSLVLDKKPFALNVSPAAPDRALPKAPLSVPFTVTDEQGAPVEGEFSVALVDEGILSLTGFLTPSPLDFFLAPRRASGHSHDAFDALLRPEAKATPLLKPGGDAALAAAYQGSLSTQPVFLADFVPVVKTDANGQGEVLFDVPEYSGKGRIMIVGASGSRFASGEAQVRFARDVELEASAPRVAAPGDAFEISLRLFTSQDEGVQLEGQAELTLSAEGPLRFAGDSAFTLPLGQASAKAEAPAAAPAEVPAEAPAAALGADAGADQGADEKAAPETAPDTAAHADKGADKGADTGADQGAGEKAAPDAAPDTAAPSARSLSVPVVAGENGGLAVVRLALTVPGREDLSFEKEVQIAVRPPYARGASSAQALVGAGEKAELALPGRWAAGGFSSAFSLSASPAAALLPSLEFLRDYPYACLEQLVSMAWPYVALPDLQESLARGAASSGNAFSGNAAGVEGAEGRENNSRAVLARFVSAIAALQRPGGGFAVWPDRGQPDPWRSVYALWLLNEIKDRVALPQGLLEAGAEYLRFVLAAPEQALAEAEAEALTIKAFAAMVLTRSGEAPLGWLQHLSGLAEKMLPSGRICLAGAMALKAGNASALKALDQKPDALSLPEGSVVLHRTLESDVRNKALLLWLWSQVDPGAGRCRELCMDIIARLGATRWHSPQESGLAALGVGAWVKSAGFGGGAYSAAVFLGDEQLAEVADGGELTLAGRDLPLPGNDGAVPSLTVDLSGQGSAYAVYSARGVPLEAPEPASNGLRISRVWKNADGTVIDLSSGRAVLQKGDRVLVELSVRCDGDAGDIVLSDLLPGGLEVENPRLNTPAAEERGGESGVYVDQREDRMLLFFDGGAGEMTYEYSARAVSRGTFVLPPLAADAMYEPQVNAVTGAGVVVVE